MNKNRWPENVITNARSLRREGLSYGELAKKLSVPRSTLHKWLSSLKNPKYITAQDKKTHLEGIRKLAVEAHHRKRLNRLNLITSRLKSDIEDFKTPDLNYLKYVLATMYWAEGSKTRGTVVFTNTDPQMSYLFITLLRKCYLLDEKKFRVRLHLHYYHSIKKIRKYWSKLLMIPENKFGKIYLKKRSKTKRFRKNFAGICFIKYYNEDLRFELLENARLFANKLAPVA